MYDKSSGDLVASFEKHEKSKPYTEPTVKLISNSRLVSVDSSILEVFDIDSETSLYSVPITTHNCCVFLGANVVVLGTGESVDAWFISENKPPEYLPIDLIDDDAYQHPSEFRVELKPASFSDSRMASVTDTAFTIWSIKSQQLLDEIPFDSIAKGFKPKYCGCYPGDILYAENEDGQAFLIDLNSKEISDAPSPDDFNLKSMKGPTYFYSLEDLGDGLFASLPNESLSGTRIGLWNIKKQTMISSIPCGVGGVLNVEIEPNGIVKVTDQEKEISYWDYETHKRVDSEGEELELVSDESNYSDAEDYDDDEAFSSDSDEGAKRRAYSPGV